MTDKINTRLTQNSKRKNCEHGNKMDIETV